MVRTVRDALVTALENLEEKDLKKFCNKIRDWDIEEGYSKIPLCKLHNKDPEEIVTVIIDFYMDQYGAQLTVAVLKAINQKKVAEELEKDLEEVTGGVGSTQKPMAATPSSDGVEHFVDRYRVDLISWVSMVDPILDGLLQHKLLTHEPYNIVHCQPTSQAKMRALYSYVGGWGPRDKDVLYTLLEKENGPLIRDLQGK